MLPTVLLLPLLLLYDDSSGLGDDLLSMVFNVFMLQLIVEIAF